MYPDKKYMDGNDANDLNFTPLSSEILNQLYNPDKNINFYTPVIMKEPFSSKSSAARDNKVQSYIRFFHTAHAKDSVDIYINSQLIKKDLSYSAMTSYISIPCGTYTIRIYKSGTNQNPLLIYNTKIEKNTYYTFAIIEGSRRLSVLMLTNGNIAPGSDKNIYVRFINLIPFSPLLNVSIDSEQQLLNEIEYGETTNYINLTPGTYSFEASPKDISLKKMLVPNVSLSPRTYYSIFAIGRADLPGSHELLIYKDR